MIKKLKFKRNVMILKGVFYSLLTAVFTFILIHSLLFIFTGDSLSTYIRDITIVSCIIPFFIFIFTIKFFIEGISSLAIHIVSQENFNQLVDHLNITEQELQLYFKKFNIKVDLNIDDIDIKDIVNKMEKTSYKIYEIYNVFNVLKLVKLNKLIKDKGF